MAGTNDDVSTVTLNDMLAEVINDGGDQLYNKWAKNYDKLIFDHTCTYKSVINKWLEYHPLEDGVVHTMFDAGCGTGFVGEYLFSVRTRGSVDLFGGDMSPNMLNEARKKDVYSDLKVVNLKDRLPYEEGSFDSVVSSGVFILADCGPGPESIKNIIRVLKKGKHFVTSIRKVFFEAYREEWEKQIRECHCVLVENSEIPYLKDIQALAIVIKKL